jgi:hypothetical protein
LFDQLPELAVPDVPDEEEEEPLLEGTLSGASAGPEELPELGEPAEPECCW